jgi:hypothetical protein
VAGRGGDGAGGVQESTIRSAIFLSGRPSAMVTGGRGFVKWVLSACMLRGASGARL